MANPETAEWINGPKFAEWLSDRDRLPIPVEHLTGIPTKYDEYALLRRRMADWRRGAQVSVEAADQWLTTFGCHLSELPEDFWEERKPRNNGRYTDEEKAEVLDLIRRGKGSAWSIAQERGINHKTVWAWMKRAGLKRVAA